MRTVRRLLRKARNWGCILLFLVPLVFIIISVMVWLFNRPVLPPNTPYIVVTDSRLLYTRYAISSSDKSVTLCGYYEIHHGRWKYSPENIILPDYMQPEVRKNPYYKSGEK